MIMVKEVPMTVHTAKYNGEGSAQDMIAIMVKRVHDRTANDNGEGSAQDTTVIMVKKAPR